MGDRPRASLMAGVAIAYLTPSNSLLGLFAQAVIYAIFALGVGVLLRQNGLTSFGHALFFGAAGYAMGVILALDWLSAELAIPVVLLGIGVLAFVIGLVIVRVPGIAFGMLTLAIGQMAYLLATRSRGLVGGAAGQAQLKPPASFARGGAVAGVWWNGAHVVVPTVEVAEADARAHGHHGERRHP